MSTKQKQEWDNVDDTKTLAYKTIQAWKDQATKAGLVLHSTNDGKDSGDFPDKPYFSLRRFRRNIAITKDHKKIITTMIRQLVTTKDEKGRSTKKEFLTYAGYYSGITYRGEESHADFEIGRYEKPRIVPNSNLTYDVKTGKPIGNEKILSGQEIVYEIEIPKSKTERKRLIDEIIRDNFPEEYNTTIRVMIIMKQCQEEIIHSVMTTLLTIA